MYAIRSYYDVSKSKIPFIVNSSYGDIRVLGTSFNVRAYGDMEYAATLVEGKVVFTGKKIETVLKPGEQLTINEDNQATLAAVDTEAVSSWTQGVISFENEPLSSVVKKLERHFDIRITLEETLAPIRFTGKIVDESIEDVITSYSIHYTKLYDTRKSKNGT